MYTTIIFDIDGTLLDSNPVIIAAFQQALGEIGQVDTISNLNRIIGLHEDDVASLFTQDTIEKKLLLSRWSSYIEEATIKADLFPGAMELLTYLKLANKKMGIVTSKTDLHMTIDFSHFTINHYFDTIITADTVQFTKPHPEPLELALQHLNSSKEETLFIGDSQSDWLCAKNASVDFALASWGTTNDFSCYPDALILQTFDDLKKILT